MLELSPHTTLLAGDWHGNIRWSAAAIEVAARAGARTILHLGDYGFTFPPGYVEGVESALERHGMRLFFVRGNHDDPGFLRGLEQDEEGFGILSPRVRHLPDGARLRIGEEIALALGGAGSIDRAFRRAGVSWWPDEMTSEAAIEQALAAGPADVVLAHDCPSGVELVLDPTFQAAFTRRDPAVLEYCGENRARLRRAAEALQPRLWVHGHYHQVNRQTIAHLGGAQTTVRCLDCDGTSMEANLLPFTEAR